jgi:hypothetical protein
VRLPAGPPSRAARRTVLHDRDPVRQYRTQQFESMHTQLEGWLDDAIRMSSGRRRTQCCRAAGAATWLTGA